MRRVVRIRGRREVERLPKGSERELGLDGGEMLARVEMIQALIPLGLEAVSELLQEEVARLAGPVRSRAGGPRERVRWGTNPGSVYLADQKVRLRVPRVRDRRRGCEIPLTSYEALQQPRGMDEGLFRRVLYGLSCRNYRACAEAAPEVLGLSPSTVSRRFIEASEAKVRQLVQRRLDEEDFVALFVDGKTFAEDSMVIALGVTVEGEKRILGFVQTGTENERVCRAFLEELLDRGLRIESGVLVVIDGSKGFRRAVTKAFKKRAVVQRCQWHKRENVVSYLPKRDQAGMRRKLQRAYEQPTYEKAKAALKKIHAELERCNQSAARSLEEGLEETLTLHRLGLFPVLGRSLKTTNCLESIMGQVEQLTGKVDHWKNSSQKRRWLASALLEVEPRLRRILGYKHLPSLRAALEQEGKEEPRAKAA